MRSPRGANSLIPLWAQRATLINPCKICMGLLDFIKEPKSYHINKPQRACQLKHQRIPNLLRIYEFVN